MANPLARRLVAATARTPLPYGLLATATALDDGDPHWQHGVEWQPDGCGPAEVTLDDCPTPDEDPAGKAVTHDGLPVVGAEPFTVYVNVACSPVGMSEQEWQARAAAALTNGEGRAVERVFWTGEPDRTPAAASTLYPHLAADEAVTSPAGRVTIQTAASVPVTGALDPVEAVGVLEGALAACYGAQGVLHVPYEALAHLGAWSLVERQGQQQLRTLGGTLVAAGAGYPGTGPDGSAAPAGHAWFYATGAVSYRRSAPRLPSFRDALDRSSNGLALIAERTYVIGWDCCHLAALVNLGGITTGAVGAAT